MRIYANAIGADEDGHVPIGLARKPPSIYPAVPYGVNVSIPPITFKLDDIDCSSIKST